MNRLLYIAKNIIPEAGSNYDLYKSNYITADIIEAIKSGHEKYRHTVQEFAKNIPGSTNIEIAQNIWKFLRTSVAYKIDDTGYQLIKSPAQVIKDGYADCKSFSIFIASILENLGIPFRYRFASYTTSKIPTHVYIIIPLKSGNSIKIDAVYPVFNKEKSYTFKIDQEMEKGIYYVSGIGSRRRGRKGVRSILNKGVSIRNKVRGVRKKITPFELTKKANEFLKKGKKKLAEKLFNRAKKIKTSDTRRKNRSVRTGLRSNRKALTRRRNILTRGIKGFDLMGRDTSLLTDGEMDLLIARDRMLAEKEAVDSIRGIGTLKAEKYQDSIDMLEDALDAMQENNVSGIGATDTEGLYDDLADVLQDIENGDYSQASELNGIGDIGKRKTKRKAKKQARKTKKKQRKILKKQKKAAKKQIRKTTKGKARRKAIKQTKRTYSKKIDKYRSKTGKFIKKAAKTAAKGVKAVAKVATAPQRLIVKGILQVALPKSAPFFLYLFINDKKLLSQAPNKVRLKRKKAEKVANFIVNVIGMKRKHFMGLVRNGIIKKYKKSPESIISELSRGKVSGIGVVLTATAVTGLIGIITKLAKLFKKKGPKVSDADSPDGNDWGGLLQKGASAVKNFASKIKKQTDNKESVLNILSSSPNTVKNATQSGEDLASSKGEDYSSFEAGDTSEFSTGSRNIWDSLK